MDIPGHPPAAMVLRSSSGIIKHRGATDLSSLKAWEKQTGTVNP